MIPAISKLFEPKAHESSHHESGSDELDHVDLKNSDTAPHCPVGSIIAWHANLSGTPALPAGWVRLTWGTSPLSATGVLTYTGSPYDTKQLPDLNAGVNATKRFLRGASNSGDQSGTLCHAHPILFCTTDVFDYYIRGLNSDIYCPDSIGSVTNCHFHVICGETTISASCYPPFMDVVWIMRVI